MNRVTRKILMLPFTLYFLFTIGLIFVQKPWEDEAMFANASYNLAINGKLAVPGFVRTIGTRGVERNIYWLPPLNMVVGAGWIKILGEGLFQRRFLSLIFGFIGLLSIYFFLKLLNFDVKFILVVLLLTGVDFIYTRYSADGRLCDVMCNSLCLAAFAVYIWLRERNFMLSVFISNTLVTLACLTHPNALLGLAGIIFLVLFFDFKKVRTKTILIAATPYIVGILGVSFYILRDIDAFISQFWEGNVKFAIPQSIFTLIKEEITKRYGMPYLGLGLQFPKISKILVLIPLIYGISLVYTGLNVKKEPRMKVLFLFTLLYLFMFTFIITKKWNIQYLIFIIPFYNCCVAFLCSQLKKRYIANFIILMMMILSISVSVYRYKKNAYQRYITDIKEIQKIIGNQTKVYGPLELGFGLGWDNVLDDVTLGYLSGKSYNYLIKPVHGYGIPDESLAVDNPEIYQYVVNTYKNFDIIWEGRIYKLYKKQ